MQNNRKTFPEVLDTLCHLSLLINGLSRRTEALTGLSWHQLMALRLGTMLTPAKVADIADSMLLDRTYCETLLDSLETVKLVLRVRDEEYGDCVVLTDKGKETLTCASLIIEEATEAGQKALLTEGNSLLAAGLQWMMTSLREKERA